ncbi:MAG: beta-ketoacyl synthase N-terminal-like domain-containing protein, partial [Acidobacteriota bacterium]
MPENSAPSTAPAARRIGVFGWGIVAPRSPNVDSFAANLAEADTWLSPFDGFGPDNFLVGMPTFDLEAYRPWFEARFKPNRFSQIESKMGLPVQYAIGAFIQALGQNPGLEDVLKALGTRTRVYVGTGLGDFGTQQQESLALYRAQRRWDRFWAQPENNSVRRAFETSPDTYDPGDAPLPEDPTTVGPLQRDEAEDVWWRYWAARAPELRTYLDAIKAIESIGVEGDVESGKLAAIKEKRRRHRKLQQSWGAPEAPWTAVSPNLLWNIDNIAAAQISMLGGLTGMAIGPAAACSTFGINLKLAMEAIHGGLADAVVVGA